MPQILGLDIGGANIKLADAGDYAASAAYPLWQKPLGLAAELTRVLAKSPSSTHLAVTMTGELADCYSDKRQGVQAILESVLDAAANRQVLVYRTDGSFVSPDKCLEHPRLAAASNWHALASYCGRYHLTESDTCAVLIDVGSTTTDIVPLLRGEVVASGQTDTQRMCSGELVYTGVGRTPLCALLESVPSPFAAPKSDADAANQSDNCSVAAELFATTRDAYLILGQLEENAADRATADGRPAIRDAALQRLARMVCADRDEVGDRWLQQVARQVQAAQQTTLSRAVKQVLSQFPAATRTDGVTAITSGEGEFLARDPAESSCSKVISLSEELGADVSRAACARAVAILASEVI